MLFLKIAPYFQIYCEILNYGLLNIIYRSLVLFILNKKKLEFYSSNLITTTVINFKNIIYDSVF